MSGPVLIAAIAAIVVVVIVISMCVLADRLARLPDSNVSITDTGRAIGAVLHAMVTIFTGRS